MMKRISMRPLKRVLAEEGLSRNRLYALLASGEIEARKVGGRTFILDASVERWKSRLPPYRPMSQRAPAPASDSSTE